VEYEIEPRSAFKHWGNTAQHAIENCQVLQSFTCGPRVVISKCQRAGKPS